MKILANSNENLIPAWGLYPHPSPAIPVYFFFFSQMLIGVSHIEPYGYISGHNIIIGWKKKEEKEKLQLQKFFSFYFLFPIHEGSG